MSFDALHGTAFRKSVGDKTCRDTRDLQENSNGLQKRIGQATFKGRNTSDQIKTDSGDLKSAANLDGEAMRSRLIKEGYTEDAITKAFKLRDERNKCEGIY